MRRLFAALIFVAALLPIGSGWGQNQPPGARRDLSNVQQPAAPQNLGIGLGSALAPGATALVAGGTGHALGDKLTMQCQGVTFTTNPIFAVASVNAGTINGWVVTQPGVAIKLPANTPAPVCTQASTSGVGTGASFTGAFAPLAAGLSVPALSNTGGNATNANLFIAAESPDPGIYGAENLFVGDRAGQHLTGGSLANTAIGVSTCGGPGAAGTFIGNFNTCLGDDAGRDMYRAGGPVNANTLLGQDTGRTLNRGFNSVMGVGALSPASGDTPSTAAFITAAGYQVGQILGNGGSGQNDLLLGTNSSCDVASPSESNAVILCAGAGPVFKVTGAGTPSTSTTTISGNFDIATLVSCSDATHAVGTDNNGKLVCNSSLSDIRLKNVGEVIDPAAALAKLRLLSPIRFSWLDPSRAGADDREHLGLTAQDVAMQFPELAFADPREPDLMLLDYRGLSAPTVAAVKTLADQADQHRLYILLLAVWCALLMTIVGMLACRRMRRGQTVC